MKTVRSFPERGAALVEMALVAPILVLMMLGIVDFGRALFIHIAIQDAAQEGAVFGSIEPSDYAAVTERVVTSLDSPVLTANDVSVTCPPGPDKLIAVTVDYDVETITPIIGDMVGGTMALSSTVVSEIFSTDPCVPSP